MAAGAGKFHASDFAEGLRRVLKGVLGMPEPTRERTLGLPPIVSLITPIEPAAGADRKSSIRQFQSSYPGMTAKRVWFAARQMVRSIFRGIAAVIAPVPRLIVKTPLVVLREREPKTERRGIPREPIESV